MRQSALQVIADLLVPTREKVRVSMIVCDLHGLTRFFEPISDTEGEHLLGGRGVSGVLRVVYLGEIVQSDVLLAAGNP